MNSISMVAVGPDDDAEKAEWLSALERTIDTGGYCLGPEVAALEEEAARYLGVPHTLGCSNGSDAIRIGLQAVGVGPGDQVIVPAYSFFSSASSIAHLGAVPVFVDVDPETLLIDPPLVEELVTDKTKAVMPVHLYGQGADMDSILDLAKRHRLAVIEDTAQSFGAYYGDRALGSLGAVGTYSFYPTKNMSAPGDAGIMVATDEKITATLKQLRVHGDEGGYNHTRLGWNARMDGFQAAVLRVRLKRLDHVHEKRAQNAQRYAERIASSKLASDIRPLGFTAKSTHVWHQYIVRVPHRDRVRALLADRGIGSGVYYPGALPKLSVFRDIPNATRDFPVAERAGEEILALPIHHRLAADDPDRVIDAIEAALS